MNTTKALKLEHRNAVRLERQNRHLRQDPAEGHAVEGVEEIALNPRRLRRAKKAYNARELHRVVRRASGEGFSLRRGNEVEPQPGDFVLARVVRLGQHRRLEAHNSRRRNLFNDDEIIVAYGHRYAPDQFLAEVPRNLNYTNLVAAGGLAGRVINKHAGISPATVIEPLGLISNAEGVLNMKSLAPATVRPWRQALEEFTAITKRPKVILVFGSSMNSGKSTVLGCLVNGLTAAGKTVNAGKATGTGAGNDSGLFRDAGADNVLDFTDLGLASTFQLSLEEVKDVVFSTIAELAGRDDPDHVVVEIADGIYQGETAALVKDPDLRAITDRVLFACGEALSAAAGYGLLVKGADLPLAAISGVLTSSPLISAEARDVVDVPIVGTYDLQIPEVALEVLED